MKALLTYLCYAQWLLLCGISINGAAQVSEQFTDGDFDHDPAWYGDTHDFEVNASLQLHLVSSGSDTSALYTASSYEGEAEWNIWFRLAFAPSDNNYVRIYLGSDRPGLKVPLNGYFLRYGENGSADGLDLWRQDGTVLTKLIDGTPNPAAASTNQAIRVKVIRSATGTWHLSADYTGGYLYAGLGSATDDRYGAGSVMGVWCKYTASNASRFYFDDIYVGPVIVDHTPPYLTEVKAVAADTVLVRFSEPVTESSATDPAHYRLDGGIGHPAAVVYTPALPGRVKLGLAVPLVSERTYGLEVSSITDFNGNTMAYDAAPVMYYRPAPFDIVISEIMADPTPVVGQPDVEYLELYNRKSIPVDVSGWKIQAGNSVRTIPSGVIPADSFLVLSVNPLPEDFTGLNAVGVPSFPALANSGATVSLWSPAGDLIHRVSYAISWYGDPQKKDGGWSLEMRNPDALCEGAGNWTVSLDASGGTPGRRNSVDAPQPVTFFVAAVAAVHPSRADVYFNHLPSAGLLQPAAFHVDRGMGIPDSVSVTGPAACSLYFSDTFSPHTVYELTVSPALENCAQQPISGNLSIPFMHHTPGQNDVVISEIMADESPSQGLPLYEYVELYNRTSYPVPLGDWRFSAGNTGISLPVYILEPGGYVTLTRPGGQPLFPGAVLGIPSFPALANAGAVLALQNAEGRQVHAVSYSDTWYTEPFKRQGGWSLEMVDTDNPCGGKDNWAASVHPDGGTPGSANSVKAARPDRQPPFPVRVGIPAPDSLLLYFSEPLSFEGISAQQLSITDGIGHPVSAVLERPHLHTVSFGLAAPVQPGIVYGMQWNDGITDCAANPLEVVLPLYFSLPEFPAVGDVVLNEVLFDEKKGGKDYIELYNRSEKALDLREIYLCNYDSATQQLPSVKVVAARSALLMPGQYLALSTDKTVVWSHYIAEDPTAFWDIPSMPSMNNGGGSVAVSDNNLRVLDAFTFTDKFHFSLLSNKDGVALERINPEAPTQSVHNWTSAAASAGYGTPCYKNSQAGAPVDMDGILTLSPEVFSPDQDGFDDLLFIRYTFPEPGNVIHIRIYDEAGRLVKKLVDGEYAGITGEYTWDGGTDNGMRPKVGIYLVFAEWFNAQGHKGRAKKAVVLGTRL